MKDEKRRHGVFRIYPSAFILSPASCDATLWVLTMADCPLRHSFEQPSMNHGKLRVGVFGRIGYIGHLGLAAGRRLRRPCGLRRPGPARRRPRGHPGQGPALRRQVGRDRRRPRRTVPRFRLSRAAVAGQVRGHLPAGHVDRAAADLEDLPAGGPRSRGRRLRPRRDGQGERPVPVPTGGRGPEPGRQDHRPLADRKVPPKVSRPARDDRLLRAEKNPGQGLDRQTLQLRRELPAHQLRGRQAGRPERSTASSWSISA